MGKLQSVAELESLRAHLLAAPGPAGSQGLPGSRLPGPGSR